MKGQLSKMSTNSNSILRLTPGAVQNGLVYFRLALWVNGVELAHWAVNSGQPGYQNLRTYEDQLSVPGNHEPLPEGVYPLSGPYWAGSPNDYATDFSSALGPVVFDLHCKGDSTPGYRSALRIHLDRNRTWAPSTDGCVGLIDEDDLRSFVAAYLKHQPTELIADYRLGTVPGPPGKLNPKPTAPPDKPVTPTSHLASITLNDKPVGQAPILNGQTLAPLTLIAELFGLVATWHGDEKRVDLAKKK